MMLRVRAQHPDGIPLRRRRSSSSSSWSDAAQCFSSISRRPSRCRTWRLPRRHTQ